jgi:hypothetical protein
MQQKKSNRFEALPDAASHPEHGILVRCDIWPRSVERSGVNWCTIPIFQAGFFKKKLRLGNRNFMQKK